MGHENGFCDTLERTNAFLGYINKKFKKSKNWRFFSGGSHMVFVQIWPFSQLFFLGNIGQENDFYDNLEQKNAFLGYRNKKLKKWKNWHFSKGVNPWFWSKNGHFSNVFFLGNIALENVFYDILEQTNALLGYINKKFKKSKNWHFSKRVNPWFRSKKGHFYNVVFFRQYRPGKCLLWYSRANKRLSRL